MMSAHLINTGESRVEKGLMSVENVGNLLNIESPLFYTRESTLEKGLMSVENVENPLYIEIPLLFI
jgi:hypothetical protein